MAKGSTVTYKNTHIFAFIFHPDFIILIHSMATGTVYMRQLYGLNSYIDKHSVSYDLDKKEFSITNNTGFDEVLLIFGSK